MGDVIDPYLVDLFQKKRAAEIAYYAYRAQYQMGMSQEDEIAFDIESCRLFLASVYADAQYENEVRRVASVQ